MVSAASRFAPAKINLFLHVGDRRPDGYHELCSLAVFAAVGDRLTVEPADSLSLAVSGPMSAGLETDDRNLVLKAARALQVWAREHGHPAPGARLRLEKNLPLASGIGGGSSDAAAALHLLVAHWSLPVHLDDLMRIAATLGADVPVCLRGQSAWMSGIGDIVEPVPAVPSFHLLLVNPRVQLPTADVFRALKVRSGARAPSVPAKAGLREFVGWLDRTINDLAAPARKIAPAIAQAEQALVATEGCLLARMSGSGATCFGIFADEALAKAAGDAIGKVQPGWWIKHGPLVGPDTSLHAS